MRALRTTICLLGLLAIICAPVSNLSERGPDGHAFVWQQVLELSAGTTAVANPSWNYLATNPLLADEPEDSYSSLVYLSGGLTAKTPDKYASPRKRDGPTA